MKRKNPTNVTSKKNYRSRYDQNRHCYRKDKETYVELEFVECEDGECRYVEREHRVGEIDAAGNVLSYEILDMMLEADNAEVQDTEDLYANADLSLYGTGSAEDDFNETGMARIGTSRVDGANEINISGAVIMSPELIGPEAVLFAANKEDSPLVRVLKEKVFPYLSEDQINLIYDYYGAGKTLEQIAAEQDKPVTKQAIANRLAKIHTKIKKYMTI